MDLKKMGFQPSLWDAFGEAFIDIIVLQVH